MPSRRFFELCQLISVENDAAKMNALIDKLYKLLSKEQDAIKSQIRASIVDGRKGPMMQQSWTDFYRAACLEKDPAKMRERCEKAESAIRQRLRKVMSEGGDSTSERHQLSLALHEIVSLRKQTMRP